jgi:hypothetical protein
MKKTLMRFARVAMIAAVTLTSATVFVACSDDDTTASADKTELNALIDECDALAGEATTSKYPQAAIDAFNEVLDAAKTLTNSADATQLQVDAIVVQLTAAQTVLAGQAYETVPSSALLIGLTFDEGTATTTQLTATGKNLVATLESAPAAIFGANQPKPSFVDGKKGKAIAFAGGNHLAIAGYSRPDFEGSKLSIAVWVKPSETRENNYIISYNNWHSWKFNLQSNNKPFFTVSTSSGGVDADDEGSGVPNNEWTHLVSALDLTAGTLDLYTNGVLVKHWTVADKSNLTGTILPNESTSLTIGTFYTLAGALTDWDGWGTVPPADWNAYFVGAMDELKVYNVALTEGQVSGIYNSEK